MKTELLRHLPDTRQRELFGLLSLSTLFCGVLLLFRMYYTGFDWAGFAHPWELRHTRGTTFLFLAWNLFLAWVPYLISTRMGGLRKRWSRGVALIAWLLFFPNAPYILTDLLHLHTRPGVPKWYDLMLLLSFAWTGLLVGFASLLRVQELLAQWWGRRVTRFTVPLLIVLCGYGVFLGRFQRWNTWDVLQRPGALFQDVLGHFTDPFTHGGTLGLAVVMSGFLLLGYYTFQSFLKIR